MRDRREERDASDMVTSLLRHALPHVAYCFQELDARDIALISLHPLHTNHD